MNVIVIMEDSFRKDHLGCYGNQWIQSPRIDQFAQESTVFDSAYAEGLPTVPVRASLFTGRYTLPFRGWQPLVQNDVLLAELLWNRGYTSAFIGDTYHMGKPEMAFSRGFDYFRMIRGQSLDHWELDTSIKVPLNQYSERNWAAVWPGVPTSVMKRIFSQYLRNRSHWKSEEDHHIAQVMNHAMHWLEKTVSQGKSDKIFLWIDSFDPHEPWDPPTKYTDMYPVPNYSGKPNIWGGGQVDTFSLELIQNTRSQYAGTISLVDHWTGKLLDKVNDLGLLENTMIILISDHGEPLGEHGIVQKVQPWPYEELSHIPLIIRMPDGSPHVDRTSKFANMPDIAPTILDFFNEPIPEEMQGVSLLPVIEKDEGGLSFGIAGFFGRSWSLRNHQHSFYLYSSYDEKKDQWVKTKRELYKYDPHYVPPPPADYTLGDQAEKENLIGIEPKLAVHLEKQLQDFLDTLKPSVGDNLAQDYRLRVSATGKTREMTNTTPAYSSVAHK